MITALVLLANGSEEMEAVIVIDVLRRAGWDVTVAAVDAGGVAITASRGVQLVADRRLSELDTSRFDLVVLPGGRAGAESFAASSRVLELLRTFHAQGKYIAAICAAPLALGAAGILDQRRFTCYPGTETDIPQGIYCPDEMVVEDETLVTSQGPGTAFAFALALVARLASPPAAEKLRAQLRLP